MFSCLSRKSTAAKQNVRHSKSQAQNNHKINVNKQIQKSIYPQNKKKPQQNKQLANSNDNQNRKNIRFIQEMQIIKQSPSNKDLHNISQHTPKQNVNNGDINSGNQGQGQGQNEEENNIEIQGQLQINKMQENFQTKELFKKQIGQIQNIQIIEAGSSLTSFGLVVQQVQQNLRKQIISAIFQLTKKTKTFQSSLLGMNKVLQQQSISDPQKQYTLKAEQPPIDLNNLFTRAIVDRDFEYAYQIFKKMQKRHKNGYDEKGFTPLYITTLASIYERADCLQFLKKILKDPQLNIAQKAQFGSKPLQQAVLFKSIPTLTNIFRSSYLYRNSQIKKSLKKLSQCFLKDIPDFSLEIYVQVASFVPLIQILAPDDTIKIHKKGQKLRIDYSLVGYSLLRTKRRKMSCIVQKMSDQDYTIIGINHQKQTFTNLLQQFQDQQLVLLIQDILSTEIKRTNPKIDSVSIKQQYNIFNQLIRERFPQGNAVKHQIKLSYTSQTQKIKPCSKDKESHLTFLENWDSFLLYTPTSNGKRKNKQMNLGLWLCKQYPLNLTQFLQIFKILSFVHQSGSILYNFLSDQKIKNQINGFPVKIQVPMSYSFYLDIKINHLTMQTPTVQFYFLESYRQQKRIQFQKTLQRRQKRAAIIKLYT